METFTEWLNRQTNHAHTPAAARPSESGVNGEALGHCRSPSCPDPVADEAKGRTLSGSTPTGIVPGSESIGRNQSPSGPAPKAVEATGRPAAGSRPSESGPNGESIRRGQSPSRPAQRAVEATGRTGTPEQDTKIPAADLLLRTIANAGPNGITKSKLFALLKNGSDLDGRLLDQLVAAWVDLGQIVVAREGDRTVLRWVGSVPEIQ